MCRNNALKHFIAGCCVLHNTALHGNASTCSFNSMKVSDLWQTSVRLAEVGQAAAAKARSWTEAANASKLLLLVEDVLTVDCS